MRITIESYAAHNINDGINTNAYMPDDSSVLQQPARAVYVPRHLMPPIYGTVTFAEQIRTLVIEFLQDDPAYWDTIKGWFDVYQDAEAKLLGHDQNGKQWYLMGKVIDQGNFKNHHLIFKLSVGDGVWRSETLNSDTSWTVSASGDQHTISPQVAGNVNAFPVLRLTPNTPKTGAGQFGYRKLSRVYNQSSLSAQAYPFDITHGGWDSAAVIADTSKSNQVNMGGGTGTGTGDITIDTAVGGGLPSAGMGYVDSEQISWTGNSGSLLTGVARGLNGTTAANHLDNAVIKLSRMQADGGDVRVMVNGAEVNYWFGTGANAINQAATKIWVNLNFSPKIELILNGALGVGALTTLSIANTKAMDQVLKVLPRSGRLQIDNEVFSYTGKSPKTYTITGVTRAINNTTAATHVDGSTIRWLEHEIYLLYGNQTIDTPTIPDTLKPVFDLTSTNTSWVYTVFTDLVGARPGSFVGRLLDSVARPNAILSEIYTGDHDTDADPATEMGMAIKAWLHGNGYKSENGELEWRLAHPFGITTVTSTGEKFRNTSSWPAKAELDYSDNAKKWVVVWNETTGTLNTWDAWTHNSASLSGTRRYIRFYFKGKQDASSGAYSAFEVNGVTLTLDSAAVPTGALDAEVSNYEFNFKITHVGSGHFLTLRRHVDIGQYFELDCDLAQTTYGKDGIHGPRPGLDENRPHYLELLPGVANVLQFDDANTSSVDIDIYWRDRTN